MSVLIEEFKKEHSKIIEAFKEVKELSVLTIEGHTKLMSLLPDLLDHLWNEDVRLYPVLKKASEHNKKLKEILSFFVNSLGAIHEEMQEFFTKYSNGDIDSSFQRDYERLFEDLSKRIEYEKLFDALIKRIEYEEKLLFPEYKMLNN